MSDLVLLYDDVQGTAEYSNADGWHGKVLNTNDLITYEAGSYNELRDSFKRAVIDWRKTREVMK